MQTSEFGVQVKSRVGNQDLTDSQVSRADLEKLVKDCAATNVKPALASNGNIAGLLPQWCEELGIEIWPNYVTIPQ